MGGVFDVAGLIIFKRINLKKGLDLVLPETQPFGKLLYFYF